MVARLPDPGFQRELQAGGDHRVHQRHVQRHLVRGGLPGLLVVPVRVGEGNQEERAPEQEVGQAGGQRQPGHALAAPPVPHQVVEGETQPGKVHQDP